MADLALEEAVAEFVAGGLVDNPVGIYERVSAADPVFWCPHDEGYWLVTSQEVGRSVLENTADFARANAANGLEKDVEELRIRMVVVDDPAHARLRSLVASAFLPRNVAGLREQAVESAGRLMARLHDRGEMDVLADFAYPFTVEMISRKLGVPIEDGPKLIEWTNARLPRTIDTGAVRRAHDAAVEMADYFQSYAHPRDDRPSEGIIRALALAEADGDRLSEVELTAICWELVAAGFETTANSIANIVVTLLQHPEQWDRLRNDPTLIRGAVEEGLRFEPPLPIGLPFSTVRDIELAGRKIPAGDRIRVWLAAANRDPEIFEDPNRFDITRPNTRQLAFSFGSHVCLGNALARMEIAVALEELLKLPDLALVDPAPHWLRHFLRTQERLPVRWRTSPN